MSLWEIFLLSIALAMDAFTVGICVGTTCSNRRQVFRLSFHFGLFQSLLALVGVFAGTLLFALISTWDHWLIFSVLVLLGLRMIYLSLTESDQLEKRAQETDLTKGKHLVILSIAVSIDALGAGIGLPIAAVSIVTSLTVIGFIAAAATVIGMLLGDFSRQNIGKYSGILAGVILILLGFNTLYDHLIM